MKYRVLFLSKTKDGSIICLHDARGRNDAPIRTTQALEEILPELNKKYKFILV